MAQKKKSSRKNHPDIPSGNIEFETDHPQVCPYCLEYSKRFSLCVVCGLMVCQRQCSIDLIHGSMCCDCANSNHDTDLARFAIRERSKNSGGMMS